MLNSFETNHSETTLLMISLLDSAIRGTLLLLIACAIWWFLRKARGAVRHGIWCLTFLGLLVMPLGTLMLPTWNIVVPAKLAEQAPTIANDNSERHAPKPNSEKTREVVAGNVEMTSRSTLDSKSVDKIDQFAAQLPPMEAVDETRSSIANARSSFFTASARVVALWILGVVGALSPLALAACLNFRAARRGRQIDSPDWRNLISEASQILGLRKTVVLLEGEDCQMPMMWGVVRPHILLPSRARTWSPTTRRIVLLHELAHVKRQDVLTQMLARLVCSLYWFHPLAWFALRQMRVDREHACDESVLRAGEKPSTYATQLLTLARSLHSRGLQANAAIGMARVSQLESRVAAILKGPRGRKSLSRRAMFVAGMGSFAITILLATADISVRAQTPKEVAKSEAAQNRNATVSVPAVDQSTPLPGLLSAPAEFATAKRWQLMTSTPRGFVRSVAWSPDGKRIAASDSGYVRICEAETLKSVGVLVGHVGRVNSVKWSPDGKRIATGGRDGTVRIWSSEGVALHLMANHHAPVRGVAWNAESTRIASAGADGTVRLWSADGAEQLVYREHTAPVQCVDWNRDGNQLASGDENGKAHIWKADSSGAVVLDDNYSHVADVCWKPDGTQLAVSSRTEFSDVNGQTEIGSVKLWNADGSAGPKIGEYQRPIVDMAWSPDGTRLAFAVERTGIQIWSPNGGFENQGRRTNVSFGPKSFAWSPDSRQIVFGGMNAIGFHEPADGPSLRAEHLSGFPIVVWHSDGKRFASTGWDRKARLWNADGTPGPEFDRDVEDVKSLAWNPNGTQIAIAGGTDLKLFDSNGKFQPDIPPVSIPGAIIAWSRDGKQIAAASEMQISLLDVDGKRPVAQLNGHTNRIQALVWSPDGKWLASGGTDESVRVWSADGFEAAHLEGFSGDIETLDWTRDSKQILTGYGNGDWQFWGLDGTPGTVQSGHFESVMALACRPDGKQVVSGGWDGTIRAWSLDGKQEAIYDVDSGPLFNVAWSPNGKWLTSAGFDRALRVWSMDSPRVESTIFILNDGKTATFNAAGKLLSGDDAAVEENFLFLVEKPDKSIEVLSRTEFLKRTGQHQ